MKVQEIPVNIRCLEYIQDKTDSDYGSCLYARFYFNLEKYELNIISDCGNYSYKWIATPEHESFLELLARIDSDYLIRKLCGNPSTFNYEETKENFYKYADEEEKDKLDTIFEYMDTPSDTPSSGDEFLEMLENYSLDFSEPWEYIVYEYNSWQTRIVSIFEKYIQPAIKEMLKSQSEQV